MGELSEAELFDEEQIKAQLALALKQHKGDEASLRSTVLGLFKNWRDAAHKRLQLRFEADNKGFACARDFSHFQDRLIAVLFRFGAAHIAQQTDEGLALVATGGYGRALLAPGSDIDLLVLLPEHRLALEQAEDPLVEFILYMLWDLGFKVGHATRTVRECVETALKDHTIRTALLDARYLCGDEALFKTFENDFTAKVVRGRSEEFVEVKLRERDERHEKSGISRYVVEPDVKEGIGGLRDLHSLQWLLDYTERDTKLAEEKGMIRLSSSEKATFRRCEEFLWTTRCHLHFLSRRPDDRLGFDVQIAMAERMNYRDRAGLRAVERFMKHYFLVARDIGSLTRIICSALELKQLKKPPVFSRLINHLKRPLKITGAPEFESDAFVIEHGRLNVRSKTVFKDDPLNILRLFYFAELHNVLLHPASLRLLRTSFHLIDDELRANLEANAIFFDILTNPHGVESSLRKMNEAGVLGRFIPDFGKIVCLMQFNMYHRYTVDEHLIKTIGVLAHIELGDYGADHPLSHEIFNSIKNSRLLYVALLLHDIAKGRDQDHSEAGRDIALELGPRLGLSRIETELVAWLVENHLVMSHFAQTRDISDPKTTSEFARIVQSRERLKLLLVLTVADIRGVGPGVWNGWKGELLRNLYYETEPLLSAGHSGLDQRGRIEAIIDKFVTGVSGEGEKAEALPDWSRSEAEHYVQRYYDDYWLKTDKAHQLQHAALVARAERERRLIACEVVTDSFTAMTELVLYAQSYARFMSFVAGACAAVGANIVSAQVSTTRDGMALDNFILARAFEMEEDEMRRAERIKQTIGDLVRGEIHLDDLVLHRDRLKGAIAAFSIEPVVSLDNDMSDEFTVIEVEALDRPGLLFDITRELAQLNVSITSAHISTFGERAVDSFYVQDLLGGKILDGQRWKAIQQHLMAILAGEEEGETPIKKT